MINVYNMDAFHRIIISVMYLHNTNALQNAYVHVRLCYDLEGISVALISDLYDVTACSP